MCLAAAMGAAAGTHDVLVARGEHFVERFAVSDAGEWKSRGFVIRKDRDGVAPTTLAALADGSMLVGDASSGGRILRYSTDGKALGVFAQMGTRPRHLCLSPDGATLYATGGNGVWCFDVASGKGKALVALPPAEGIAFGGDGLLYAACPTVKNRIAVIDTSAAKVVAKFDVFNVYMALALGGADGSQLILPTERPEAIDLIRGRSETFANDATLRDVRACAWVGERLYAVDFPSGDIYALDVSERRVERVGTGAIYAMAIVDLTAAASGRPGFSRPTAPFRLQSPTPARNDLARMSFNNPTTVVDLKAGFYGDVLEVLDYDKDGRPDIYVRNGGSYWPWCGNYLFLNRGDVFEKAKRLTDEEALPLLKHSPWAKLPGADGMPLPPAHFTKTCFESRTYADYDGDGLEDAIIAAADREWDEWHDRYDSRGIWTAGHQLHGYVYWCRRLKGEAEAYAPAEIVRIEDGLPLEVYGNDPALLHDWDGDGDLDFVVFDFRGYMTYFENIGSRRAPVYTSGRLLHDDRGAILKGDICLPLATAHDWDGDGRMDILLLEEDSRVGWFRHTGRVEKGLPTFERIRYFRQRADELCFGALATPCAYDWDGDGDQDIICGNSHGRIAFIENLSGPGVESPKWAAPVCLTEPDGKIIWMKAGPNGSIQGPCESEWGYAAVCVCDWDCDGLPDVMANNTRGEVRWWRNIGTRTSPKLDFAQGVAVEWNGKQPSLKWGWIMPATQPDPKWIVAPWRTTPVMHDFNGDGLPDLMLMDGDGNLAYYERMRLADGRLALKPPRKAFLDEDGRPIKFPGSWGAVAGGAGRYKFSVGDWDGDGRTDIIYNAGRNACLLRLVGEGADGWRYRNSGPLAQLDVSTHNPAPAVCDFNGDGVPDLLMGAMDGFIYYLRNERTRQPLRKP